MKNALSVLFLLIFMGTVMHAQDVKTGIVPSPRKIESIDGKFKIPGTVKIVTNGGKEDLSFQAGLIKSSLKENNGINASVSAGKAAKTDIFLEISNDLPGVPSDKSDEAYILNIDKERITIKAASGRGILYGTMSLLQLLENNQEKSLACVKITDWPGMKMRGISDDISRGQVPTLDNMKKIVRFLARYKMNIYMPYIEDVLEFDSFPSIGKGRGALTKAEVKELVSYAKQYYIDVIPAFQTLGHYENILSMPEFLKYAEFPGAASLCVSDEATYTFLETLLKEVCELFPSEYFNMGADESYDVGLGRSKYLVDKSSIAMVHLEHYKRVYSILKKYGKKVMMYGDIILSHPEILEGLPKDITVVDWHYRADSDYPSTATFAKYGIPYLVSPTVWNFTSVFPVHVNAMPNIQYIIASGLKNGSAGMINSNWGDFGAETIKELLYYGYAWSAQCSWNFEGSSEGEFTQNFLADFFGVDDSRLSSVYDALSSPFIQLTWNELWRHPLLPQREPAWWEAKSTPVVKMSILDKTLYTAERQINELKSAVKKNADHLDILTLTLKLCEFNRHKISTAQLLKNSAGIKEAAASIDENISLLKQLKKSYSDIWLKYYKQDNLNMIEDKFDRLIAYYNETKQQLASGPVKPAVLQSPWIYCKTGDSAWSKSASFSRKFTIKDVPSSAKIQLFADTYARINVNGEKAGEVYVKRSLSLWTEYKRVLFTDIAKYLKPGENEIKIEVDNYFAKGAAGFNIITDITPDNSAAPLMSDESWTAQNLNGTAPAQAAAKDYPYTITAPNFAASRPGWIER